MAGRGGKSSSLTREQLQAMGIGVGVGGKEMNSGVQLPPPLFPPLVNKPGPPDDTLERQYKIMWKDDFVNFLKDSPYFLVPKVTKDEPAPTESGGKAKEKANFCWNLMPPELKPNFKRTIVSKPGATAKPALAKRKKTELSVDEKLKLLEEKETKGTPANPVKIKTDPDNNDEDEEMEDDAVQDDEMDDENDYGNSYFDNGESFNEEDDNLDDGPVY